MIALPFLHAFVAPATVVIGTWLGGWGTFFTPLWLLVGVAAIDRLLGAAPLDLAGTTAPAGDDASFRLLTWAVVPVHGALLAWTLWTAATAPLSAVEVAGLTVSAGFVGGAFAITAAHELVHRTGRLERTLGVVLLAMVNYMHFPIEHVHGHHRHVGTPRDPATARLGESLYAFFRRTVPGQLASAWRIETARLRRRNRAPWSARNRMLWYAATPAAVVAGLAAGLGWGAALVYLVQGLVAALLLETINYVEHYGLERRGFDSADGTEPRYEPLAARHSWNTNFRMTNWGLFNLGRHADHHLAADRRYQNLRNPAGTPQLPGGYPLSFMLALVPPLWRRVVDPRALAWRNVAA